jgi:SagB-type dehydrogenase family enzyme
VSPRFPRVSRTAALWLLIALAAAFSLVAVWHDGDAQPQRKASTVVGDTVWLAAPKADTTVSVEQALARRRSRRSFTGDSLTLSDVSLLVWAAQGITNERDFRTAPSAGALYPLETYVAAARVEGLTTGVYRYLPRQHMLVKLHDRDVRAELAEAASGQPMFTKAPVVLIIAADYKRTERKYGVRAERYVHIEAGAAAQNVYLMCEVLGLGTCLVGAFDDDALRSVLGIDELPMALMPVGVPSG